MAIELPLIHFETLTDRPRVFRITQDLISAAKTRSRMEIPTSFGEDLKDLSPLSQAVGLVTHNDVLLHPNFPLDTFASRAPHLRWVHVTGAGIEPLLPLNWLPPRAVLTNNSGIHVDKIRESAAMMLLMLNAHVPAIVANQHKALWQPIFSSSIVGRTVLIIGVGDMGGAVAQAARQLGLNVLGVRRSGAPHPHVQEMFRPTQLDSVLPQADFVVLSVPLTKATTGLLNHDRLMLMKPGASLINIGRAGSLDHDALIDSLDERRLSGAILDVFPSEPLVSSSPLWQAQNLILMQHVTSDDEDQYLPKTFDLVFKNVQRLMTGKRLLNVVDPEIEY
jgi:phosphoglycerate dehydrogenase-like enzyme